MKHSAASTFQFFGLSVLFSAGMFAVDVFVSNRLATNVARIVCSAVCAVIVMPLFIIGMMAAFKKGAVLLGLLNLVALVIVIGYTVVMGLVLYAFRDFQFVLPDF